MNEDYSGQAKKTRKYWIMGVSAGVVFILLIGSFFIYQGMKKRQYVKHTPVYNFINDRLEIGRASCRERV